MESLVGAAGILISPSRDRSVPRRLPAGLTTSLSYPGGPGMRGGSWMPRHKVPRAEQVRASDRLQYN